VPLIAIAAVLLIKLAVLLELGRHPLLLPNGAADDGFYAHLADSVAQGDISLRNAATFAGHPAPVFPLPPLYIYVLAILLKLSGGSVTVVRTIQTLLGTMGVALLSSTARRWYGESAAWWTLMGGALFRFSRRSMSMCSRAPSIEIRRRRGRWRARYSASTP
jgi:hypothetical protein